MKLIIGNKNYSSWSLRPWLVLKYFSIDFAEICVPLYQDNSKATLLTYSPAGKVPTLVDKGLTVWDSLAICEYLAEQNPNKQLWPTSTSTRALARSICSEMHSGFDAIRAQLPMNCKKSTVIVPSPEVQQDVQRICEIWRSCRSQFSPQGDFLFGQFSIADAFFAPVVLRFKSYSIETGETEKAYMQTILTLPEMVEWIDAGQAETNTIAGFED